ncbi:hypothetical protein [Lacinutrix sp.]|uniref:hypothetical protein n=1 Tax=Lacinutrix sp. TaxID=1937692 RepID=UPI0025C719F8|nr:hypothetical protein [Lacinutrix sp.]
MIKSSLKNIIQTINFTFLNNKPNIKQLFGNNVNSIPFDGKHVVNMEIIGGLV